MQKLHVSTTTARESAPNALMCEESTGYFRNVIDALSKCVSPKQILNMDKPELQPDLSKKK
jgi:hypothetical protein